MGVRLMNDDLAGLRHDMEMALDAADKQVARMERRIDELESVLEEHLRNSVRQMEQMAEFTKYVEKLANDFNAHGHSVDDVVYSQHLTGRPVKVDG
jgi:uncharacterized coiled-coil protein SlyX